MAFGVAVAPAAADPSALTWTAALVAWFLAVPLWYLTKFAVTTAHEGGHASIATLSLQGVSSIKIFRSGGGATAPHSPPPWLSGILIYLAGYLGPSMFGVLAAWLLTHGRTEAVLWGSLALLFVTLLVLRGLFSWLVVLSLMAVIWAVAAKVDYPLRTMFAHVWVWFLLIGAVERMLVYMTNKDYTLDGGDAAGLAGLTGISREFWAIGFLLGTIAALLYGGVTLLRIGA